MKYSVQCSYFPLAPQHIDQATAVAYEDQQKINLFARKNARLVDLQEQIASKKVGYNESIMWGILLSHQDSIRPFQFDFLFLGLKMFG